MSIYEPAGEFDPLAKLLRAERSLMRAGSQGENIAEELKEVRRSIRAIIEQRAEQQAAINYPRDYGRER